MSESRSALLGLATKLERDPAFHAIWEREAVPLRALLKRGWRACVRHEVDVIEGRIPAADLKDKHAAVLWLSRVEGKFAARDVQVTVEHKLPFRSLLGTGLIGAGDDDLPALEAGNAEPAWDEVRPDEVYGQDVLADDIPPLPTPLHDDPVGFLRDLVPMEPAPEEEDEGDG